MDVNMATTKTTEQVIGLNLRARRHELELTQEQAGERIGRLLGRPWSRASMSIAEGGGRSFGAAELLAMARGLVTSVEYFFRLPLGVTAVELPGGTVDRIELAGFHPINRTDDPARWLLQVRENLAAVERVRGGIHDLRSKATAQVMEILQRTEQGLNAMRDGEGDFLEKAWHALAQYEEAIAGLGQDDEEEP
jgi:transcriptional regulator with XRE-family HTH domain